VAEQKRIAIKGAILVSKAGLCIAGDLGIDKDIDIVTAMFNAVSQFVEDTFERAADQIKMGDMFITKATGKHTTLWVTSTGTSESLIKGVSGLLGKIEKAHGDQLAKYKGIEPPGVAQSLKELTEDLAERVGSDAEDIEAPELGFSILEKGDVHRYLEQLEDAYNLYMLTGEMETAFQLANDAADALEHEDPETKDSSLFRALAAKVMVQTKGYSDPSYRVLKQAEALAKEQKNSIARAEVADAWASYNRFADNNKKARKWSIKAKDHLNDVGLAGVRELNRLINYELGETITYLYEGRYDEAVSRWKELSRLLEKAEDMKQGSDVDAIVRAKHRISVLHNIGFGTTMQDRLDPDNYGVAVPYYEHALEMSKESNARWLSPVIIGNLGVAMAFTGDLAKGEELVSDGHRMALELKNPGRIAISERNRGVFHYVRGSANGDKRDLYQAMQWFYSALDKQSTQVEIEYINFFMYETERKLKRLIGR